MNEPAPASTLIELISASWMSQAICAAAELNIADHLANGAKHVTELAVLTHSRPASLRRLMRALASLDLCVDGHDDSFDLTATGALLRTDAVPSLRSWAIWWGRYRWPLPGELRDCVQAQRGEGPSATDRAGRARRDDDAAASAVFNQAMVELTRLAAVAVTRVRDFSTVGRLVDVGGGFGEMLVVLLAAYPRMQGVLFDLPSVIDGAAAHLDRAGVAERCELVRGSFFDSVPGGGDVYLLKSILHSWNDEQSRTILRNCRRAMTRGAKLVLVERVMPVRMSPCPSARSAARSDLHMLVGSGGVERTRAEFEALLGDAGFGAAEFIAAGLDHWVIEAAAMEIA